MTNISLRKDNILTIHIKNRCASLLELSNNKYYNEVGLILETTVKLLLKILPTICFTGTMNIAEGNGFITIEMEEKVP